MIENPSNSVEAQALLDSVRVPDGNVLLLQAHGRGVQIYACPADAHTPAKPHAILLKGDQDEGDLVAIHYAGPTGPVWEALDGSLVVGEKKASVTSPDADGVDWLLLHAKSTAGNGLLSKVTFIQRLYTDGGKVPASGCDQGQSEVLVEYSAKYLFYVAADA